MKELKVYTRKGFVYARPYEKGEDLSGVSVGEEDDPADGGMIAFNPENFKDRWFIATGWFEKNYRLGEKDRVYIVGED